VIEPTDIQFEVVGDPEALPDAFFDALASLLLAMAESECPNGDYAELRQDDTRD
jgi:hypothetical protein